MNVNVNTNTNIKFKYERANIACAPECSLGNACVADTARPCRVRRP